MCTRNEIFWLEFAPLVARRLKGPYGKQALFLTGIPSFSPIVFAPVPCVNDQLSSARLARGTAIVFVSQGLRGVHATAVTHSFFIAA